MHSAKVYFLRHAATNYEEHTNIDPNFCWDINEEGERQCREKAEDLKKIIKGRSVRLVCGPRIRHWSTMHALRESFRLQLQPGPLQIHTDQRLDCVAIEPKEVPLSVYQLRRYAGLDSLEFLRTANDEFRDICDRYSLEIPFQAALFHGEEFRYTRREGIESIFHRTLAALYEYQNAEEDVVLIVASEDNLEYAFSRLKRGATQGRQMKHLEKVQVFLDVRFQGGDIKLALRLGFEDGEKSIISFGSEWIEII
jgi:broad specificity phosphatase PhoE